VDPLVGVMNHNAGCIIMHIIDTYTLTQIMEYEHNVVWFYVKLLHVSVHHEASKNT